MRVRIAAPEKEIPFIQLYPHGTRQRGGVEDFASIIADLETDQPH